MNIKNSSLLLLALAATVSSFSSKLYAEKKEHFLSFVMPCYNCSKTIRKSLDSIYQQNITTPFEVVCTNDASTDNTLEILREYQQKYTNFVVIEHPRNKGGGAACNTCVYNARGDLLFRLDSDNILAPNTIDRLINLLDSSGCDGATVEELRFFRNHTLKATGAWFYKAPGNICDLRHVISTNEDPAASGNYLYTRASFDRAGGYPEKHGSDTFCFGFKQYATGTKIAILPNTFYWHLHNDEGYWAREERTGANQNVALEVVTNYKEVFTKETKKLLQQLQKQGYPSIFRFIENKKLKLIPTAALEQLFAARKFEHEGNYEKSYECLQQAIKAGCSSKKIARKIQQLKTKTNSYA